MNTKLSKLVDAPYYSRDLTNGAVIATDKTALNKYQAEKRKHIEEAKKFLSLQRDVAFLLEAINDLRMQIEEIRQTCNKK